MTFCYSCFCVLKKLGEPKKVIFFLKIIYIIEFFCYTRLHKRFWKVII